MNQSQSIGISARGRALGFGHALGPWALGPGLGPGRRALCAGPAAAWAQARAQGPGPAQRPRPRLQSFSPRPGPGQSLGMHSTCMIPGMPRAFIIRLFWVLAGSGPAEATPRSSRQFRNTFRSPGAFGRTIRLLETMPNRAKSSKSHQIDEYGSVWAENLCI